MDGAGPSGGFFNVDPRSREQRLHAADKWSLEKQRIAQRSVRAQPPPENVLLPDPISPQYVDEHTRFAARDAAAAEHVRRQEMLAKREANQERKRVEGYVRTNQLWERNEKAYEKDEYKVAHKRELGEGGVRRNKSSESYNIISLDYANTPQGQALKYKDQTVQYKAQLRAQNLYNKNHSVSHNIITGQPVWQPPLPQRPVAPWDR